MGRVASVLIGVALLLGSASADISTHPLLGHPDAVPEFTGSTHFYWEGTENILDVVVDYAVFAPGAFPGDFDPLQDVITGGWFPDLDPSDYVYAYQIHNADDDGVAVVSTLGLGLAGGTGNSLGCDEDFDPADGLIPDFGYILPDVVYYWFLFEQIERGQFSEVVLLSSPNAPTWHAATVVNSGLSAGADLPSPIPAPGAVVLGTVGLALVAWVRRQPVNLQGCNCGRVRSKLGWLRSRFA